MSDVREPSDQVPDQPTFPDYELEPTVRADTPTQLKALGHPVRNAILHLVIERAATTGELAEAVGKSHGTVAHHLKVLEDAGLVRVVRTRQVRAVTERYYYSQCVKDETMAESIAAAFDRQNGVPGTIVHFTGSFHSDFGAGTAERVRRRLSGRRVAVVSLLPVEDIDTVAPGPDDAGRAEYLVYTVK